MKKFAEEKSLRLVRAAVETLIAGGHSHETAQTEVLRTLARIAAANGPKSLHRLFAHNREYVAAGCGEAAFVIPEFPGDCDIHIAVPVTTIRAAHGWLVSGYAEERKVARQLWEVLDTLDK